jgi:hypothetical protein
MRATVAIALLSIFLAGVSSWALEHDSAPGIVAPPRETPCKRPWDPTFLDTLDRATKGAQIRFELVAGAHASGTIQHLERAGRQVTGVWGVLIEPEPGRFFFQKQTLAGAAGPFVGVVEFTGSQRAFRLEPSGPSGASELVERPLTNVVCLALPLPAATDTTSSADSPLLPLGEIPEIEIPEYQNGIVPLESLPGATAVVYLDFQGGYTPAWGGVTYERPNVSNAEIRDVWVRVAEDFRPFSFNITTDLRVYQQAPENSRQRVIITYPVFGAGLGGLAYTGSFNWTGEHPCWVFIVSGKRCAESCSHEVGHALGLSHSGVDDNGTRTAYFAGHGTGETGWAPIMGLGYVANVTQWSKGEYRGANNTEDQLEVITTRNNHVAYRADDTGDRLAGARHLALYPGDAVIAEGVIERTADIDAFQFATAGGAVWLRATPASTSPNLALEVALYDASDTRLAGHIHAEGLSAELRANLPAGTYTFCVTGAGRNDPLTNGFSPYGSLGSYSITGTVANAQQRAPIILRQPPSQSTLAGGAVLLDVAASGEAPLSYQWLKDGSAVPGASSASLVLSNATRQDSGAYAVAVSNPAGTARSSLAIVRVRTPQKLETPRWISDGCFSLSSADATGGELSASDLSQFQAQVSSNLLDWIPLRSGLTLTNGSLLVVDPDAAREPLRFYRLLEQ